MNIILDPFIVFFNPQRTKDGIFAHWSFILFYLLFLMIILAGAFTYRLVSKDMLPHIKAYINQISPAETVKVQGDKAIFDKDLPNPYVRSIKSQGTDFAIIYHKTPKQEELIENTHENFVLFSEKYLYIRSGKQFQGVSYADISQSKALQKIFGNPLTFSPAGYYKLLSFLLTISSFIMIYIYQTVLTLFSCMIIASITRFSGKNTYTYIQNLKCVIYALPPLILMQGIGSVYLPSQFMSIFAILGMFFQAIYATQALRQQP